MDRVKCGNTKKNSTDGKLSLNEACWKQHNSPLLIACQDSAYLLKIIFFGQTIFYKGHGQGQFCLLLTFVEPVRDPVEDLPSHAVPRHADHLGPRVLSRARVTCHESSWVSSHLLEVDVVGVHHDQAPAPGPGRVLQPRVLARGHAQPHQRVRGASGGQYQRIFAVIFLTKPRGEGKGAYWLIRILSSAT